MTTAQLTRHEIDVRDVEYIRHGGKPLLARVYVPRGSGPFPLVIDLHGGAWCNKDRTSDEGTDAPLAKSGVVVASLDFRMPPEAGYPASLQDVNYAVRWFKQHAKEFKADPQRVGILGVSSGGHQAMLTAMRPRDGIYNSIPLADSKHDASVQCAIMCWPVIDPLYRYGYAHNCLASKDEKLRKQAEVWVTCHDKYWPGTAEMEQANPARMVARGETIEMPPVIYIQGTADVAHPAPLRDKFIKDYRAAGGRLELHLFKGVGEAFITTDPNSEQARSAVEKIIEFVHRELD
jgi:acetyl esterase/lipase